MVHARGSGQFARSAKLGIWLTSDRWTHENRLVRGSLGAMEKWICTKLFLPYGLETTHLVYPQEKLPSGKLT
jgi:hypothetical protein